MIYLQSFYARRRDPISVGLQNAFQPMFDLTEAMAGALRRLDADERRARVAIPTATRPHSQQVHAAV